MRDSLTSIYRAFTDSSKFIDFARDLIPTSSPLYDPWQIACANTRIRWKRLERSHDNMIMSRVLNIKNLNDAQIEVLIEDFKKCQKVIETEKTQRQILEELRY